MNPLKTMTVAALAAVALMAAGCKDRSASVLDRDEGTVEETREAVDRKAKDVKQDVKND